MGLSGTWTRAVIHDMRRFIFNASFVYLTPKWILTIFRRMYILHFGNWLKINMWFRESIGSKVTFFQRNRKVWGITDSFGFFALLHRWVSSLFLVLHRVLFLWLFYIIYLCVTTFTKSEHTRKCHFLMYCHSNINVKGILWTHVPLWSKDHYSGSQIFTWTSWGECTH